MKYIDINQKFTAKVAEYIAKGYTINTATMSGSQGEHSHGKPRGRFCREPKGKSGSKAHALLPG